MFFKGTLATADRPGRSAKEIAVLFDEMGGKFNASTSREHTNYYARVVKEDFNKALGIMAEMLKHSAFEQAEIATRVSSMHHTLFIISP